MKEGYQKPKVGKSFKLSQETIKNINFLQVKLSEKIKPKKYSKGEIIDMALEKLKKSL